MIRVLLGLVLLSACTSAPRLTKLEVDSESVHTRTYFLDDRVFGLPYRAGYFDSTYLFCAKDSQLTKGFLLSVARVQKSDSLHTLSIKFYKDEERGLQHQLDMIREVVK